jgi:hypothetical protein
MKEVMEGFSHVEYLTTFVSLIYSYIAARFFMGWRSFIAWYPKITFSFPHQILCLLSFGLMIDIWWTTWVRGIEMDTKLYAFNLALITPAIFYLIVTLLFPNFKMEKNFNLREYYQTKHKTIYLLFGVLFLFNFLTSPILENRVFTDTENIFRISAIFLGVIMVMSKSPWVHHVLLVIAGLLLLTHIILFPAVPSIINAFSFLEYTTIFSTFLYGFIASQFLSGWGAMINFWNRIVFSKEHLAWTILLFFILIGVWWTSWDRVEMMASSIHYFFLSLISPLILFLMLAGLFPNLSLTESNSLITHFIKHHRLMFLMLAIYFIAQLVTGHILETLPFLNPRNYIRISAIVLAFLAAFTDSSIIRRSMLVFGWILLLIHMFIF